MDCPVNDFARAIDAAHPFGIATDRYDSQVDAPSESTVERHLRLTSVKALPEGPKVEKAEVDRFLDFVYVAVGE
jgi:hypothetical protein